MSNIAEGPVFFKNVSAFPTAVFLSIDSSKEVYLYFLLKMFVKLI